MNQSQSKPSVIAELHRLDAPKERYYITIIVPDSESIEHSYLSKRRYCSGKEAAEAEATHSKNSNFSGYTLRAHHEDGRVLAEWEVE